jgi:hypothetical protein
MLELAKLVSLKLDAVFGNVDPETAMAANGRGALNHEADGKWVIGPRRNVDVLALDLGRAIVVEW